MQPRRPGCASTDADVIDELPERQPHDGVKQPLVVEGREESRFGGSWLELVAQPGVVCERLHAAGVQGYQARFPELGLADQQHPLGPVDVPAVELDGLADPQPARREKPDQRLVGRRPQRRDDPPAGRRQQRADVSCGVDERPAPGPPARHQAQRRHLGAGVDPGQVAGEAAGGRHPPWPDGRHPARR